MENERSCKLSEAPQKENRQIYLGNFKESAIDALAEIINDFYISHNDGHPSRSYIVERAKDIINNVNEISKNNSKIEFGIYKKDNNVLVGIIGLRDIKKNETGEIGYSLSKKYVGNNYATDAVGAMLYYAFESLKLQKVFAYVLDSNIASQNILIKNGFKEEQNNRRELKWYKKHLKVFIEKMYIISKNNYYKTRESSLENIKR